MSAAAIAAHIDATRPADVPRPGYAPHERALARRPEREPSPLDRAQWTVGILTRAVVDYRAALHMLVGVLGTMIAIRTIRDPSDADAERDVIAGALQRRLPRGLVRSIPPAAFSPVRAALWAYTSATVEALAEAGWLTDDGADTGRMVARAYWHEDADHGLSPLDLDSERIPLMRRAVTSAEAQEAARRVLADHRRRVALGHARAMALMLYEREDGRAIEAMGDAGRVLSLAHP